MNNMPELFGLRCPDGREAQLLSVQVHGEILGLMLRLTVRQVWRNSTGAPMATRLRFPLGWDQTLLALQVHRPQGTQSLDKITRENRLTCSATPGVLATGEQVTLEWRIGQLLDLQGSSLRVALPAGLVPHAPRPAQIQLEIHDPVALGTVSCPSHDMQKVRHANGVTLSLRPSGGLDKDLVLTVHGLRDTGFALASPNPSGDCTVLVSACPRLNDGLTSALPLRMKLLVDSSSAMPSERLSQIRAALDKLLAQLQPEDQLSYSRFGEHTVHDLPRLQVCTEAYQRRVRALARHTDTDLGQGHPAAALQATLAITDEEEETVSQADILLITASPIWAIDDLLRSLRASGHRLHVMAVGAAVPSLWRELAQASAGSCETLDPGQHSQQTLARLIDRMRHRQAIQAHVALEGARLQTAGATPARLTDGDTLHLWAQATPDTSQQDLIGHPELRAILHWQSDHASAQAHALPASPVLWDAQGDLARLCAAREALQLNLDSERQQLLAQHRLVQADASRLASPVTPGPTAATVSNAPVLQRPKVLPVKVGVDAATPHRARTPAPVAPAPVRSLRNTAPRHADLAGWLSEPNAPGNPLSALVQGFNAHAGAYGQFRGALSSTLHQVSTRFLETLVLQLTRQAGNPGRVWALLLYWLHTEHELPLQAQALQLVEQELASLPVTVRAEVNAALSTSAMPVAARQAA
jgi:Ca-activated chloride channel homolog